MKRAFSSGSNSNAPPAQRAKTEDVNGWEEDQPHQPISQPLVAQDTPFFLRHQNRALSAELLRYRRTIADLEARLGAAQAREQGFDATLSVVHRVWTQMEGDLKSSSDALEPFQDAAQSPPPSSAAAAALGELLRASGQLATADITDRALLRRFKAVRRPERTDVDEHDVLVTTGDASSGSESDDSRRGRGRGGSGGGGARQVDASLRQRAQFATDLTAHIMKALRGALGAGDATAAANDAAATAATAVPGARDALPAQLLAQKREAAATTAALCDSLALVLQRRHELTQELRAARRDHRRALRKLERLAAAGVPILGEDARPNGHAAAAAGGGGGGGSSAGTPAPVLEVQQLQQQRTDSPTPSDGPNGKRKGSASARSVDGEARMPADEADALRLDLVAAAEAATRRLAEVEQLRKDKPAALPGARHPDLMRLEEALETEKALVAEHHQQYVEKEQEAAAARAECAAFEAAHVQEAQARQEQWVAQVAASNADMGDAMIGLDGMKAELERAQVEVARAADLRFQLASARERLRLEEMEAQRLRDAAERAAARVAALEAKVNKPAAAAAAAPRANGAAAAGARVLEAKLAETAEELSQSKSVAEAVAAEVETTAAALEEALAQSRALSERLRAAEREHTDGLNKLRDSRLQCDLLTAQKSALEWRCEKAEMMKAQADAIRMAASSAASHHDMRAAAAAAVRDDAQRAHDAHCDARECAAAAAAAALAELRATRRQLAQLTAQCDALAEREEAARAGEERAREHAAAAQRRAERTKLSLSRLQAQLAEGGLEVEGGGAAAGDMGEETALLAEEAQELRKALRCSVCSSRQKDCVLTKCYHMFCRQCVDENLRARNRKCPACGKVFGADDVHSIYIT
ncbi:hypothetical protein JKP88DRAFT_262346 [Tribonema minus]|uniref:E3 ubiquitin protein ligase n=1 Tax=Tribonema minus TaxID=303371 RepID=A0A835Z779_9STRA|nr:hypothetical protein JKP88DRAFT_262346 [Tribonema minus]